MKKKFVVAGVVILVVGCIAGALIFIPSLSSDNLEGNIGKASRFSKSVVSERSQLIVEKLRSDSLFRDQTLTSLTLIAARAGEFDADLGIAVDASSKVEEMSQAGAALADAKSVARNAALNSSAALLAVQAALEGEDVDVERPLNNAILSYLMIGKNLPAVQEWSAKTAEFLRGRAGEQLKDKAVDVAAQLSNVGKGGLTIDLSDKGAATLALAHDQLQSFCLMQAFLSGDHEKLGALAKSGAQPLLLAEQTKEVLGALSSEAQSAILLNKFAETQMMEAVASSTGKGLALLSPIVIIFANSVILKSAGVSTPENIQMLNEAGASKGVIEAVAKSMESSALFNSLAKDGLLAGMERISSEGVLGQTSSKNPGLTHLFNGPEMASSVLNQGRDMASSLNFSGIVTDELLSIAGVSGEAREQVGL